MKNIIYYKSPYFIKCILASVKGCLNNRKRYNKKYIKLYNIFIKNYNSEYEEVLIYQKEQLIKLLTECYLYSDFYKNRFLEKGFNISHINNEPFKVLASLPILSKQERKSEVERIINKNPKRKTKEIGFTSGTTGTPTKNYLDEETSAVSFALWNRFHYSIRLNKKDKHIRFSSNLVTEPKRNKPPFWVYNNSDSQLLMSVFHLKEDNLKYYIEKINSFKPVYLDGFPSAIYVLSEYINRKKIILSFKPFAVCTTAETLFDYQRKEIEKAFGCKVYNQYASSEGSPFITECKYGKMHVEEDSGIFEFLDDNNQPVKSGQIGRMVVTSLRSWKTPLLRYDILDYVEMDTDTKKCKCGSPFKYVKSVHGRANDMLWTFERGYVSGGVASALKNIKGIKQVQIIQKKPNDIFINIVKDKDYTDSSEIEIIENLKDRLGQNIGIRFNYVSNIEHNLSGKLKLLIREFKVEDYIKSI
ncbi:MAG: hypothetical protein WCY06_01245 [Flavobacteriaceae bacterium]